MDQLPQSTQQINDKVEKITAELLQIAQKGGFNLPQVVEIWSSIPLQNTDCQSYLESANRVILEVSELVDNTYPTLSPVKRAAYKLNLMGELLCLKAYQLN